MHWKNKSYISIFFILILVSSFLSGCTNPPDAAYQLFDDIVYQEIPDVDENLVSLDIYVPSFNQSFLKYSLFHHENNKLILPRINEIKNSLLSSNDGKPVMIWVHGGGWRSGDKTNQLEYKIPYFINENWIFVSVKYRLSPYDIPDLPEDLNPNRIKYPVHSQDVAAAVAWVHNNIEKYGGDPNQISLMGHSAGANIVSTIGTNETFLKEHGLNLSMLQHIISLDTAAYDIRERCETGAMLYLNAFGTNPSEWDNASPLNNIKINETLPSFFVVVQGTERRINQSIKFIEKVNQTGAKNQLVITSEYDHSEVNQAIGHPDDEIITPELSRFLGFENSLQFKWAKLLSGPTEEDEIDAVASDNQGNVYVSGKFEDNLTIDGQSSPIFSNGMADIMVVKYNKDGTWQWTKNFGGSGEDNIFDAVCDNQGNLILSGYFQNTVKFGNFELTAQGGFDMVLLKINPNGNVINAIRLGGSGNDGGNEVAIGNSKQIVVGAQSDGTFEGINNTGSHDAYIISITSDFTINWIRSIEGSGLARAKAVEIDGLGNVYLGGDYRNENFINSSGNSTFFEIFGKRDAYLASWTENGNLRWIKNWGGSGNDLCKGIVTTNQNEIYAVGQFTDTVDFYGSSLTSVIGSQDLFVWMLNNQGTPKWIRHIKASENLPGAEVTTDTQDNLYFGLGISGIVEFQTSNTDFTSISSCGGQNCPILIQYNTNGNFLKSLQAERSENSRFGEIAFSHNTIFVDCVVKGGPNIFGNEILESQNGTKDASILAIDIKSKLIIH